MIDYIINENKMLGDNQLSYILGTCLSTDAKPVLGIYFNSMLFETDTQSWYVFDKTKVWKKSSGSGGGTTVVANPELVGTEDDLTGLQVEETKYKIPSGGGSGILVVNAEVFGDDTTLDKTWKEIYDSNFSVLKMLTIDGYAVMYFSGADYIIENNLYTVRYIGSSEAPYLDFTTNSENGYPTRTDPGPGPK